MRWDEHEQDGRGQEPGQKLFGSGLSRRHVLKVATVTAGVGALSVAGLAVPADAASPWSELDKRAGGVVGPAVVGVRTGAHFWFDRLVVDFGGPEAGPGWVGYTSGAFWALGTGRPYLVGGTAHLMVFVTGASPLGLGPGQVMVRQDEFEARGFESMVDLVFGGSLDDFPWTSIALGLRGRRSFRLSAVGPDAAGHARLVLDVHHRS